MAWPLTYIKDDTKINIELIKRETDYLSQMGYIEKKLITTSEADIAAYSCKIIAQGINIIESHKFLFSLKITKKIWWFIAVLVPLIVFYLDLFGLKAKFLAIFDTVIGVLRNRS